MESQTRWTDYLIAIATWHFQSPDRKQQFEGASSDKDQNILGVRWRKYQAGQGLFVRNMI